MPDFKVIPEQRIADLSQSVLDAQQLGLALSSADLGLIYSIICGYAYLLRALQNARITLKNLRSLLGIEVSSERRGNTRKRGSKKKGGAAASQTNNETDTAANDATSGDETTSAGSDDVSDSSDASDTTTRSDSSYRAAPNVDISPTITARYTYSLDLSPGDPCPLCAPYGKVYEFRQKPFVLIRITAHAPLEATEHTIEQLRCNACDVVFTATVPDTLRQDGPLTQKYGYSAQVLMVVNKFLSGTPYYHQSFRYALNGLNVSPSSIYDQIARVAEAVEPVVQVIRHNAAQSPLLMYDDTRHKILQQEPETRPNRNGKGERKRTGVYCSQVIGVNEGREHVVCEISLGHAGELIDDLLRLRSVDCPQAMTMSDAASVNRPTVGETCNGLCNAHARRGFIYAEVSFPEEAEEVLEQYQRIWKNEKITQREKMTPQERLDYHHEHSLPVMEGLKAWCEQYQTSDDYEEHGALGKAVNYFLNHFYGLSRFCFELGMPLDNNRSEETLKFTIRGRKQYHFFKTAKGAAVASTLLTLLLTCIRSGENPEAYLLALLQNQSAMQENPACWQAHNYRAELAQIEGGLSAQVA